MSSDKQIKIIDGIEYEQRDESDNSLRSYDELGSLHSFDDKPAVIYIDGTKVWRKNGEFHRDNDKPAIVYPGGLKKWYVNNKNQPDKYFVCIYVRKNKQYKKFFATELQAKQFESEMLAKGVCSWVIENV